MPEFESTHDRVHLIDATMFWNASGGVRRYIGAKRRWMQRHTAWRLSLIHI